MPKEIHREALFATIFTFIGIFLLHLVLINVHALDPLESAFKDLDLNDILYSKLNGEEHDKTSSIVDTNIILVNIGDLNREGIATLLDNIGRQQPAAIGLDATFKEKKDPYTDSLLKATMAKLPNLVTASSFVYAHDNEEEPASQTKSNAYFGLGSKEAYTNFIVRENQTTVRYYLPFSEPAEDHHHAEAKQHSFSSKLVQLYNPTAYQQLSKHHNGEAVMINYAGKLKNFIHLAPEDISNSNMHGSLLKGKIVVVGYLGDGSNEPKSLEDLHFTPYNPQYAGRSFPDMYGAVIHANILAMVLHDTYIRKVPTWLVYILAFLLCWAHMYFFLHMYVERHLWFHVSAKLVQLGTSIILVLLALLLLSKARIKLDCIVLIIPIILSVDLLDFYETLIRWLNKRFGHQSYLLKSHGH